MDSLSKNGALAVGAAGAVGAVAVGVWANSKFTEQGNEIKKLSDAVKMLDAAFKETVKRQGISENATKEGFDTINKDIKQSLKRLKSLEEDFTVLVTTLKKNAVDVDGLDRKYRKSNKRSNKRSKDDDSDDESEDDSDDERKTNSAQSVIEKLRSKRKQST